MAAGTERLEIGRIVWAAANGEIGAMVNIGCDLLLAAVADWMLEQEPAPHHAPALR